MSSTAAEFDREILKLIDGLYLAIEALGRGERLDVDLYVINDKMEKLYNMLPTQESK
jgi:hypothetical protein